RIGTLDSLFAQLARTFSLEMGLPPRWRILDEADDRDLRDAAIEAVLHSEETTQLLALTHLLSKGEAVRGVSELIRDTVTSLHGLYCESDAEAWQRLRRPKSPDQDDWHELLDELRNAAITDGRMRKAAAEDCERALRGAWDELLQRGLSAKLAAGETTYYSKPIPAELCGLYERLLEHVRATLIQRVANQTETSYRLLHSYDTHRRRLQVERGGLRFDDITQALDTALRPAADSESRAADMAGPGPGELAHRLDGQVSHLLLDEFQDTSPRQWRALQGFVQGVTQGDGGSFFCVGDMKQAIYGWRGGVAEIFTAVDEQIPDLEQQQLNQSFRSSHGVIEFVNRVFQGAVQHPQLERAADAVAAWCDRFEEHTTANKDWTGYACLRTAALPDEDQDVRSAVLASAVELVAELHVQSPADEIGVLVRRNATVARLVDLLRARGLPASEEGGNPLTDSAAVQLVVSALRLADHPGDRVARFHVAESPLGPALRLATFDDDGQALRVAAEIRHQLQTEGYGPWVGRIAAVIRPACGGRDQTRLDQLVERAYAYQSQATLRARDFVRKIELERVAEPSRAPIRVMTIHQAKGLEFDHVVLPELDENLVGQPPEFVVERLSPTAPVTCVCLYVNLQTQQLLPLRLQRMFAQATHAEVVESLCLLYVALTRAVHTLHVVIPASRRPDEKISRTMAGIVRAALVGGQPLPPATVVFACGDPQWRSPRGTAREDPRPAAPEVPSQPAVRREAEPVLGVVGRGRARPAIRLADRMQRLRGLERVSPSGLEGGMHVRIGGWLQGDAGAASLRGTILHACLAQVHWIDDGPIAPDALRSTVDELLRAEGRPGDPAEWIAEFDRVMAQPLLQTQLSRSFYRQPRVGQLPTTVMRALGEASEPPTVETEWAFAVRRGDGLLAGSIDRLVLFPARQRFVAADILDFKTDALPDASPAALRERIDYYAPQIAAYRDAVSRLTGLPLDRIAARLLFLSIGEAVRMS
ncbi:MAG: UvrD-helicase domain-containing protein, partial [Pirellulaceae bacterium]